MYKSNGFILLIIVILVSYITTIANENPVKIKKLTKRADLIITGKVKHKKSSWNEKKTRIYTKTTLQVDEFIKGKANNNSIEITYPGGEIGDIGEIYTHMPRFERNEEVLVFLKKDKKHQGYKVLDGEEGKIKILKDVKSKEHMTGASLDINDLKSQIKRFINEQ